MKTISELNNKVWYRFLKVVCILFFLLALALVIGLIYSEENSPKYDNDKSYIGCIGGKEIKIIDTGITLFDKNLSSLEKERFEFLCAKDYTKEELKQMALKSVKDKNLLEYIAEGKYLPANYTLVSFYTGRNWLKVT
ncbi:hypothetical protein KJ784_02960, partial [Patescibacteria group bacterium]|nr:hypothetical protein [Patescibacteria group bacterium]